MDLKYSYGDFYIADVVTDSGTYSMSSEKLILADGESAAMELKFSDLS